MAAWSRCGPAATATRRRPSLASSSQPGLRIHYQHGRSTPMPVGEDHDADVVVDDAASQVWPQRRLVLATWLSRARWHRRTRGAIPTPALPGAGSWRSPSDLSILSLSAVQCDLSGSLAASRVPLIMRPRAVRKQSRRSSFTGKSASHGQRRRRRRVPDFVTSRDRLACPEQHPSAGGASRRSSFGTADSLLCRAFPWTDDRVGQAFGHGHLARQIQ
jgi:hypothetical protein